MLDEKEIGPLILKEKIKTTPENRTFFSERLLEPSIQLSSNYWINLF